MEPLDRKIWRGNPLRGAGGACGWVAVVLTMAAERGDTSRQAWLEASRIATPRLGEVGE
jgi:hypothetical protein